MLKILVKEINEIFEGNAEEFCNFITYKTDFTEEYDSLLDECYEPWEFGGCTYYPSEIFKKVDPMAYDIDMNEYADRRIFSDLLEDLEQGEQGIYYIGNLTLDIIENENE